MVNILEETILIFWYCLDVVSDLIRERFYKLKGFITKLSKNVVVVFTGDIASPVCKFIPGTHTVSPDEILTQSDWLNQYKVSFMHGWRSNPIYIEDHEVVNYENQ